jgi:hypothetical protein
MYFHSSLTWFLFSISAFPTFGGLGNSALRRLTQADTGTIVTYPGIVWLKRRVLDLIIEFIEPLYTSTSQITISSSDWTLPLDYSDFQLNLQHCPHYSPGGESNRKHHFQQYPEDLQLHCLAMDGLLLFCVHCCVHMSRACLPSRCLEMGLCITQCKAVLFFQYSKKYINGILMGYLTTMKQLVFYSNENSEGIKLQVVHTPSHFIPSQTTLTSKSMRET